MLHNLRKYVIGTKIMTVMYVVKYYEKLNRIRIVFVIKVKVYY